MNNYVKCIENKANNSNFTKEKIYEVFPSRITCNFVHVNTDEDLSKKNEFEFGCCKFIKVIKTDLFVKV